MSLVGIDPTTSRPPQPARRVWLNVPFRRAGKFLRHYLECKERAPAQTSAVIVLPKWENKPWWQMTQGLRLLKTYPAGTQLFTVPSKTPGGPCIDMGPTKWPVCVFWNPPTLQGFVKPLPYNATTEEATSEKPSKEEETPELCGFRPTSEKLIRLKGKVRGHSVTILVDLGAGRNYMDPDVALLMCTTKSANSHPAWQHCAIGWSSHPRCFQAHPRPQVQDWPMQGPYALHRHQAGARPTHPWH